MNQMKILETKIQFKKTENVTGFSRMERAKKEPMNLKIE